MKRLWTLWQLRPSKLAYWPLDRRFTYQTSWFSKPSVRPRDPKGIYVRSPAGHSSILGHLCAATRAAVGPGKRWDRGTDPIGALSADHSGVEGRHGRPCWLGHESTSHYAALLSTWSPSCTAWCGLLWLDDRSGQKQPNKWSHFKANSVEIYAIYRNLSCRAWRLDETGPYEQGKHDSSLIELSLLTLKKST